MPLQLVVPSSGSTMPAVGFVGALDDAAFFHHEAVARRAFESSSNKVFSALRSAEETKSLGALRETWVFDFAEVALQIARGLARRRSSFMEKG